MTESNRQKLTGMYVNESYQDKPIDTEVNKPLTGLYINETKKGDQYLSGKTLDGKKYTLFKNGFKEKDNQPDWVLYVEDTNLQKPVGQSKEFKLSSTPKPTQEDMPF